ncbi:MAG TPA: FMN-binding protein [Acidimicrobiales bacterium]|nr:FMN-binding protein [Acidimicrobiales bacterium]
MGTALGVAGVLSFHTAPASLTFASSPTNGTPTGGGSAPTTTSGSPTGSPTTAPVTPSTTIPSGSRTATGPSVNYNFGVLSVTVKATGKKVTSVTIGTLNDGGNYRSQSIDSMAIPILEREAMAAQSANIQSVSGASYTSAGFAQSLQSALQQLGI